MPSITRRTKDGAIRLRGGSPSSCCYCIIPCPCPPGKIPRTPLVSQLLDGKRFGTLRFTFNHLSHVLSIESLVFCTPLVLHQQPDLGLTVLLGAASPSVAWVVPAVRYVSLVPRGPLGGLSTSSSGTQAACALGLYDESLELRLNERCSHKMLYILRQSCLMIKTSPRETINVWINYQE
jgi:hypothetical protein